MNRSWEYSLPPPQSQPSPEGEGFLFCQRSATFQSFGCETAIAVASLATELIRGKTAEEALALKAEELAGELGPLPPMKIHCSQLVEGALRSALSPRAETCAKPTEAKPAESSIAPTLLDSFSQPKEGGVKIQFLE